MVKVNCTEVRVQREWDRLMTWNVAKLALSGPVGFNGLSVMNEKPYRLNGKLHASFGSCVASQLFSCMTTMFASSLHHALSIKHQWSSLAC